MAPSERAAGDRSHARQHIPIGTLKSIIEGSGLEVDDFR
jgi:hypothetical protein